MRVIEELKHFRLYDDGIYWVIERKDYSNLRTEEVNIPVLGMKIDEGMLPSGRRVGVRFKYPKDKYKPNPNGSPPERLISTMQKMENDVEKELAKAYEELEASGVIQTVEEPKEKKEESTGKKFRLFRF